MDDKEEAGVHKQDKGEKQECETDVNNFSHGTCTNAASRNKGSTGEPEKCSSSEQAIERMPPDLVERRKYNFHPEESSGDMQNDTNRTDEARVEKEEGANSATSNEESTDSDDNGGGMGSDSEKPPEKPAQENSFDTTRSSTGQPTTISKDAACHYGKKRRHIWCGLGFVAVVLAVLIQLRPQEQPQRTHLQSIDIFHHEMDKMKVQYPSQREEFWKRSRIHLQRNFLITQPTEPVSIILTAGVRAHGTLRCLAKSIASALSSALNTSALYLDEVIKASQDSDAIKSDIDRELQNAFENGKLIAVVHRFEELPPASTLIFYRYCDHENAAYKKTFFIFTVLLEEEEIQAKIRLSEVEEMVTDHLQKKFISHGHSSAFDKMDIDKYSGLWSRISHLVLPVVSEKELLKKKQC